jgi:hypothetical protein
VCAPALHCVHVSRDELVYVCERGMNRIQVFTTQGTCVNAFSYTGEVEDGKRSQKFVPIASAARPE